MPIIKCPNCGVDISTDAVQCYACGYKPGSGFEKPLEKIEAGEGEKKCFFCNAPLPAEALICYKCGSKVETKPVLPQAGVQKKEVKPEHEEGEAKEEVEAVEPEKGKLRCPICKAFADADAKTCYACGYKFPIKIELEEIVKAPAATAVEAKKLDEKLAEYDRLLRENPNNTEIWFEKGRLLTEMERYKDAKEAFDKVIALNPHHKFAWIGRTYVLNKLGESAEAAKSTRRAMELTLASRDVPIDDFLEAISVSKLDMKALDAAIEALIADQPYLSYEYTRTKQQPKPPAVPKAPPSTQPPSYQPPQPTFRRGDPKTQCPSCGSYRLSHLPDGTIQCFVCGCRYYIRHK